MGGYIGFIKYTDYQNEIGTYAILIIMLIRIETGGYVGFIEFI